MSKSISQFFNIFAAAVFIASAAFAQENTKPTFGIGLNGGIQKPFCDVLHTGLAITGEGFMRFLISDRFNVRLGLGFGELSDGFSHRTFHTNVFNADLQGNIYLKTTGLFRPYGSLGFGAINYTYNLDSPNAIGDPQLAGKALWDVAFIFGGGADLMLTPKFAINASADYRHTPSDGLDGAVQGASKDGYLTARLGLVIFTGQKSGAPKQDLLADESLYSEVKQDTVPTEQGETDAETADILALLMGTETPKKSATQPPAETGATDMQNRVDELKAKISAKDEEIATLETELTTKDSRIQELQRELDQAATFPGDFSTSYKEALRLYSVRDFDKSIAIFRNLRLKFPQHKLASNCIYWIGENNFMKGDYVAAIEAFNEVFNYESSYKKDDAMLMLGRCYNKLRQNDRALGYFEQLISQHPDSEYVTKAEEWINRIK